MNESNTTTAKGVITHYIYGGSNDGVHSVIIDGQYYKEFYKSLCSSEHIKHCSEMIEWICILLTLLSAAAGFRYSSS